MEDNLIVALYWKRDEAALKETAQKYERYLTTIAYNILCDREDSKESVNDTYLKAWNSMPPNRPFSLSTCLGKITRQLSVDRFRTKNRKKRRASQYALALSELSDCISKGDETKDTVEARLLAAAIEAYLSTLSDEARNLFLGRYYFFDSLRDVAAYCQISQSKARSILYRTRQGLRVYLQKEGWML